MGILTRVTGQFRPEKPEGPYKCLQCGACFELEYYTCPECESFSVERRSIPV